MEDNIKDLLISFLGDYSKQCGEWYSFNCPCCADENFGQPDDKYNLEVKIDIGGRGCGGFHCWKCGDTDNMRGNLGSLIKKYGNATLYRQYKEEIDTIRKTQMYDINFFNESNEVFDDVIIKLPKDFKKINLSTIKYKKLAAFSSIL